MQQRFVGHLWIPTFVLMFVVVAIPASAGVTVTSPLSGSTSSSPVHFVASATSTAPITTMRIYVDYQSTFSVKAGQLDTYLSMSGGSHTVTVQAWDSAGAVIKKSMTLNVAASASGTSTTISVSPTTAVLQLGYSHQFSATVSGSTNTGVTWSANGVQGGNSTTGTISSTGVYKAPATMPSSSTVTVTAKSTTDTTKSANATVSLSATPTTVKVAVSPTSASVQSGQSKQFTSTVSGTTNTGVVWSVNGITSGNSSVGSISPSGLYTAPGCLSSTAVTITARSSYDSSASANASLSLTQGTGTAGQYYVATTGSDSNPGTACKPWRTITKAAATVTAGATVHVAPGTYNETITSKNSGTSTARIRFLSDARWGAKVVSAATGGAAAWRNNGSYVTIEGFDMTCPKCYFGIWNWGSYVFSYYNHIHNMASAGTNPGAGIDDNGYTAKGNEEVGNVIHHIGIPGNGVHQHGIYHASPGGKINNNILYHNEAWGINLRHAANGPMVVANNTIFDNGGSLDGSYFTGGGISFAATDAGSIAPFDYLTLENNIIYGNRHRGIYEAPDGYGTGTHNNIRNNLLYNNRDGNNFIKGNLGSGTDINRIAADPQFVNYQPSLTFLSGNYRVKSSSPSIGKGTSSAAPTHDVDFAVRPTTGLDQGAYEYGAPPATYWPWQ